MNAYVLIGAAFKSLYPQCQHGAFHTLRLDSCHRHTPHVSCHPHVTGESENPSLSITARNQAGLLITDILDPWVGLLNNSIHGYQVTVGTNNVLVTKNDVPNVLTALKDFREEFPDLMSPETKDFLANAYVFAPSGESYSFSVDYKRNFPFAYVVSVSPSQT